MMGGVNNVVNCLTSDGGSGLYVGGNFTTAGGLGANHVAHWDGVMWSGLGTGTNAEVFDLAMEGRDLFVAGAFTNAGGG